MSQVVVGEEYVTMPLQVLMHLQSMVLRSEAAAETVVGIARDPL